jgi:acetylornithine deacetylase/succinyl-diaminopimelate desuccinylase-like protein
VTIDVELFQEEAVTGCAEWLRVQLDRAVVRQGLTVRRLPSGAGHDGMAVRAIADVAMLFVRCKGGISHHPAEAITAEDTAIATRVLLDFIREFQPRQ